MHLADKKVQCVMKAGIFLVFIICFYFYPYLIKIDVSISFVKYGYVHIIYRLCAFYNTTCTYEEVTTSMGLTQVREASHTDPGLQFS
jgi:hypothetical protein